MLRHVTCIQSFELPDWPGRNQREWSLPIFRFERPETRGHQLCGAMTKVIRWGRERTMKYLRGERVGGQQLERALVNAP